MFTSGVKFSLRRPTGKSTTYSIRFKNVGFGWKEYKSPGLSHINERMLLNEISKEEAEERVIHLIEVLRQEYATQNPTIIMNEANQRLVQQYLDHRYPAYAKRRLATGSYESVVYFFNQALEILSDTPLETDVRILQEKLDSRLEDNPRKHKRMCSTLNSLLNWLGKEVKLEPLRDNKWEVNYITEEEFSTILPQLEGIFQVGSAVAFWTGVRLGELCALTMASLRGDYLYIDRQINRDGDRVDTKTRKERRVWLQESTKNWITKWLEFPEADRHAFRSWKPSKKVGNVSERYLGRRISFHDLRHSRAVYMISRGVSLEIVAQNLGNSPRVCEKHYYGHVLSDSAADMMKRLLG